MFKEFVIFTSISVVYVLSNTPSNYGPFSMIVTESRLCKGPKRKDCCDITTSVKGESRVKFDIIVKENASPSKGKFTAMSNGKELFKFHIKKPCNHVFLRPVLHPIMNITKDCVILKGHYYFNIDVDSVAQALYGGMFMYGNWTFKSLLYSDDCNFACVVMQTSIIQKNNTN